MKTWLLKFHRWLALLFAVPLLLVFVSGLILSFEPWLVVRAIKPNSLALAKIETILEQRDPSGKARAISYRAYDTR